MTWSKLIDHVRRAEKSCTKAEARRRIGNAIAAHELRVRWADERKPPFGSSPFQVPGDEPPRGDAQYWAECETHPDDPDLLREPPPYDRERMLAGDPVEAAEHARLDSGDPVEAAEHARLDKLRRFRKPEFQSVQVVKRWPLVSSSAQGENIISSPGGSARKDPRGRRSERDKIHQTLAQMRLEGVSLNKFHKTLAVEVAIRNGVKLGDKGWSDRTVVEHISGWKRAHPELPNE
jgi:hypothetical protein